MPPDERAISITDLTVECGGQVLLDEINLDIEAGSFIGISGPNGAGKTTLFLAMLGFRKPSQGKISVLGKRVTGRSIREIRTRVGFVPQTVNIDPRMPISAFDVLLMGRNRSMGFMGRVKEQDREIIDEIASLVGVEELLRRPFGQLSGGERQRVLIGRALAQEPEVLMLDEAASNLDAPARESLKQLVNSMYIRKRITTLYIAHDPQHLPESCREIAIIDNGRLLCRTSRDEMEIPGLTRPPCFN